VPVQARQDLHQVTQRPRCVPRLPLQLQHSLSLSLAIPVWLARGLEAPVSESWMYDVQRNRA
jgi:hypothetical protein